MPKPPRPVGLSPRARLIGVLVALLLQAALIWIYYQPAPKGLVGDETVYLETARAIGEGEGDDSELLRPTLYAHLLSALDVRPRHRLPIQILQFVTLLGAALLLRSLTRHLLGSPRAADLVALAMLIYPTLGAFSHYFWPDILHLGLWITVLWILATGRRSAPWLLLAGSLLTTAILTRHLLLVFVPLVAAALWLDTRERRSLRLLLLLAPIFLIAGPTLLADWSHDGRLRSTSNVRFNLWVGLNDQSRRSLVEPIVFDEYRIYATSAASPAERDAILEGKISDLVAAEGWSAIVARQLGRQYFRLLDKETFFTEQLPGGAIHSKRRGYRLSPGMTANLLRGLNYVLYAGIIALAAFGIASSRPRDSRWLQLILIFLAYNLAIFLLLHVKSRYRLQLTPFLMMFAAYGLDALLSGDERLTPYRLLAGFVGAGLLLLLAFGGPLL